MYVFTLQETSDENGTMSDVWDATQNQDTTGASQSSQQDKNG